MLLTALGSVNANTGSDCRPPINTRDDSPHANPLQMPIISSRLDENGRDIHATAYRYQYG